MRVFEERELEFDFASVPDSVMSALSGGSEAIAVRIAVALGNRDENRLSDLVFFWRHPERSGRKLVKGEPGFDTMAKEWLAIRDNLVRPAVTRPSTPSGSSPGAAASSVIARVWAFVMGIPTKASSRTSFVKKVSNLQLTDIALMINSVSAQDFAITPAKQTAILATAEALRAAGVDTHLVTWLRPTERYMSDAATVLRDLCVSSNARSLMFDVEEPWTRASAVSGSNAESKAKAIVDRYWQFTSWPCPLGASGITYIPASVKPVAARCDYVVPQAYSINNSNNVYRPGVTQKEAHKRWSGLGKPIVMGLAAYKLNHYGGLSDAGAMQKAITTTQELGDNEVAYCSLEWISVPGAKADFIRQASTKARKGISQKSSL
jgi:hypothetical protein